MRTRSLRFVLGTLGLAVLVSCSSASEGSPKPAPTSDTKIESTDSAPSESADPGDIELPYAGAPKVDDPLDTTRFQQNPCESLTVAQAQELNVSSPGEPREAPLGQVCNWRSKVDRTADVEVAFQDKYPHGLSATYQAEKDGKWVFFEELEPIQGYPAVIYGQIDQRDTGGCRVEVGVSDEIAFDLVLQLSAANVGKKDPCETAAMVAGMALQTMKAAQ